MNHRIQFVFTFLFLLLSGSAYAVNEASSSYQTGHLIGKAFAVVLVLLVLKKLFFSNKS